MRRAEARWIESKERWRIDVQKDGVRKSFYSSAPSAKGKREVEKKAEAWLDAGSSGDIRFGELWEKYLKRCQETTGTPNYMKHEQMGRLWLLPSLRHRKMSTITPLLWQECIDTAYKKGLSKKTCMNIKASIMQAIKFARQLSLPVEMPEFLEIPKGAPTKDRIVLQPAALRILFSDSMTTYKNKPISDPYIYAYRFMVLTGLRLGELCGLQNADVSNGYINLKRSINSLEEETRGKNDNARRTIALSSRAKAVLQEQNELLTSRAIISYWAFPDKSGGRMKPKRLYDNWKRYIKHHGYDCSIHELRHTMISIAQGEVPEALLKQIVGHSASMDTHGVYGHEIDGEKERAARLLETAFDRILK